MGQPFSGNVISSGRLNRSGQALLSYYPLPNANGRTAGGAPQLFPDNNTLGLIPRATGWSSVAGNPANINWLDRCQAATSTS